MDTMQEYASTQMARIKEDVLQKVYEQCVGRPFNINDHEAGRFTIGSMVGVYDRELIMFDGAVVGALIMNIDTGMEGYKMGYTFNPEIKTFK